MDGVTGMKLREIQKWLTKDWTQADWEDHPEEKLFEELQMWAIDLEDQTILDDKILASYEFEQHMGW